MFVFHSMPEVTVYITVTICILLWLGLRRNPFSAAGAFVQEIFTSGKYLLHFVAMVTILMFNKLELWLEKGIKPPADFTPSVYSLEGNFVYYVQHLFKNDVLTWLTTYFYVVIFPALMIVSIGVYTYQKNFKLYYAICYAIMFNYLAAIPFYLFFPVYEVWSVHPQVEFLMSRVFPTFETDYRPLSGLDNCFPSLHTAISVSVAVIAIRSNNAFWRRFSIFSASFIIFSIFYLGVHWLSDACAGLVLGIASARLGLRLCEGRTAPQSVFRLVRLKERNIGE